MSTSLVPSPEPTTTPVRYVTFTGDGSEHAGWPTQENWLTFNDMFKANREVISKSCSFKSSWGQVNSPQETQDLYDAILQVSGETNFDERMILAVVMQESSGCMRVEPTYSQGGVFNPGLMQDHNGTAMCHDIDDHLTFPCPKPTIVQMIREGTSGTPNGKGLIGVLEQARNTLNDDTARSFYAAARLYNSGEYSEGWESDLGQATAGGHCYSSDIANRLIGWVDGPYGHCALPI
ncbi:putative muramidase [Macrophomina phaseolina]|uniref:Muramidase n=1 Tax=Macrophomina phaseolina TaxID=35725 RepID=A0ABQ8GFI9_9PEZI|nr:putative muramidase [Macrophomina phaseolina]